MAQESVSKAAAYAALDFSAQENVAKATAYAALEALTGTPALPVDASRLTKAIAAFFAESDFAGRAPRRAVMPAAHAAAVPLPFAPRAARVVASHFVETPFKGGRRRGVGIEARPGPPQVALPAPVGRTALTLAAFFGTGIFAGRPRSLRRDFYYGGAANIPRRASQVVLENLIKDHAGARASQAVIEAHMRGRGGAKASQVVAQAVYQQINPTFVRASQVVVEVLVPNLELPPVLVYPVLIGLTFDYVKRPKWSTGTGVASSGREVRIGYWTYPQWEWDLTYDHLPDTGRNTGSTASDIKTLIGFVLAVYGAQQPFFFQDPDDNTVAAQALGIGDGATTTFEFIRTYGQNSDLGDFDGTEPVGSINESEPITIYLNGVAQETGFTINTGTPYGNYITFATAPGAGVAVTASFSFYYFCRLKDDSIDFDKFMSKDWSTKKLTLFSIKN